MKTSSTAGWPGASIRMRLEVSAVDHRLDAAEQLHPIEVGAPEAVQVREMLRGLGQQRREPIESKTLQSMRRQAGVRGIAWASARSSSRPARSSPLFTERWRSSSHEMSVTCSKPLRQRLEGGAEARFLSRSQARGALNRAVDGRAELREGVGRGR